MTAFYIFVTASTVLILDRLTKYIIIKNLLQGQSVSICPGIFHITLVLNKGAAFGLLKDQGVFFIALSFIIVSFIIFYIWQNNWQNKKSSASTSLALGLILGGATGNLIDRVRFGYVIDFLDFRIWPVFNLADSSITIGAVILIWKAFKRPCTPSL